MDTYTKITCVIFIIYILVKLYKCRNFFEYYVDGSQVNQELSATNQVCQEKVNRAKKLGKKLEELNNSIGCDDETDCDDKYNQTLEYYESAKEDANNCENQDFTMTNKQKEQLESLLGDVGAYVSKSQEAGQQLYYKGKKIANKKDMENAYKYAYKKMCESKGFNFYSTGDEIMDFDCTHTEATCKRDSSLHKSNSERSDNSMDHLEWRPNQNECVLAYEGYIDMCKEQELDYDNNVGRCQVTREYCECRGIDYKQSSSGPDCKLKEGQKEASYVVGKTLSQHFARPPYCITAEELVKAASFPIGLIASEATTAATGEGVLRGSSESKLFSNRKKQNSTVSYD